jgi:NTP pyrophosphatase (non-canonical NTP hydrolase)
VDFTHYQIEAAKTDRHPGENDVAIQIPMLGLAGEVGTLLSQYKKYLRDGDAHQLFKDKIVEELGDILWYASNVATKFHIDLADVARRNLAKTVGRWGEPDEGSRHKFFDDRFPTKERFPRWFEATFYDEEDAKGKRRVRVTEGSRQIGDFLTDNAHEDDGYRFHDAFHFAYACVLGWSPVTRRNLKIKRKSDKATDEVEDGARAIIYEEVISGLVFENARHHGFYETARSLDFGLLDTLKRMTERLEVGIRSTGEWEKAIIDGFDMWRLLRANGGGTVRYDLENRQMVYVEKTEATASS